MSLEPRFGVSPHTSIVAPSIMCGNKECEFHIWGKLLDFHDKTKDKPEAYYYTYNRFMNYDHERDSWSSGVFNKSKRRKGY